MRIGVAVLGLLLVAGEAQAADQFDLVCKGQIKHQVSDKHGEPYSNRYRIDLTKQEWCAEDCSVVHHFAEITTSRLTFEYEEVDLPRKVNFHWVDRATGKWLHLWDQSGWFQIDGSCDPAPFSGLGASPKF